MIHVYSTLNSNAQDPLSNFEKVLGGLGEQVVLGAQRSPEVARELIENPLLDPVDLFIRQGMVR